MKVKIPDSRILTTIDEIRNPVVPLGDDRGDYLAVMKSLTVYHCVRSLLISVLAFTDTQGLLYLCVYRFIRYE